MSGRSNRRKLPPMVQTRAINLTRTVESVGRSVLASNRGAVDEALPKVIQTLSQKKPQLHLMNQATGLVAHRVEILAQSAGGRQFQPQMIEPESERDRLL